MDGWLITISFIKKNKEIVLCFTVEYFSNKKDIEISLFSENKYDEFLEERIIKLENENKEIKKEIAELKAIIEPINKKFKESININKHIFNNNSFIMKQNEFDLISFAIKSRLNKNIKELKKLYQATIDGDSPINFHSRCDNIPNTLTLMKSSGNRRFGGFASECWKSTSSCEYKDDINAFLFSLDKQKIYSYKKDGKALDLYKSYGPTFGVGPSSIYIGDSPIQNKYLCTNETNSSASYNFYGDKNALSESGGYNIYASEIEVFQVIFED